MSKLLNNVLIYGAYGYTGRLIVERALKKELIPILGGRNISKIEDLAKQYNLKFVVLNSNSKKWDTVLKKVSLVLNCAGPFALTVKDIVPKCIEHSVHYLDITGEIEVFEYVASLGSKAKEKNTVLMCGAGFDVVPTDCLSSKLHAKLPTATHLELAFRSTSGISRGTALSMAKNFHAGCMIRENGQIKKMPLAYEDRLIQFGEKEQLCVAVSWGDIFTAYYSTKIKNIKVYAAISKKALRLLRLYQTIKIIAKTFIVQWILKKIIKNKMEGPSTIKRATCITYLWGRVSDSRTNQFVEAELTTPETYHLTALTAVESALRVLKGKCKPGYQTPVTAFGNDYMFTFDKVKLKFK